MVRRSARLKPPEPSTPAKDDEEAAKAKKTNKAPAKTSPYFEATAPEDETSEEEEFAAPPPTKKPKTPPVAKKTASAKPPKAEKKSSTAPKPLKSKKASASKAVKKSPAKRVTKAKATAKPHEDDASDKAAVPLEVDTEESGPSGLGSRSQTSQSLQVDEEESSEEEWEEVEEPEGAAAPEPAEAAEEGIEIVLRPSQLPTSRKEAEAGAELRRALNRFRKEQRLLAHKAHLLCFVCHGRLLRRLPDSATLQALCLSLLPPGFASLRPHLLDLQVLTKLHKWFRSAFQPSPDALPYDELTVDVLAALVEAKTANSSLEKALVFLAVLGGLGCETRLVLDPFPVPLKQPADTPPAKTQSKAQSSGKKVGKKDPPPAKAKRREEERRLEYWAEVWMEGLERWVALGWAEGAVDSPSALEAACSSPMAYALAFESGGGVRDVTRRYSGGWVSGASRRLRAEADCWEATLRLFPPRDRLRARQEDLHLHDQLLKQPLPASLLELRNHPLYAVKKFLKKYEAIYPADSEAVGLVRGEAVFAREAVHTLHAKESWLKEARVIRVGEEPYKVVPARRPPKAAKASDEAVLAVDAEPPRQLALFGFWQTEPYVAQPAVDGKIPRNAYGNVDLFQPSMLPPGTVQLRNPGLAAVARRLGVDCAQAMVGYEFQGRATYPVFDGFVVCVEDRDALLDAWDHSEARREERARQRRSERALKNWARLVKGLRIRARVQAKYNAPARSDDAPVIGSQGLGDSANDDLPATSSLEPHEERALAWPPPSQHFTL